MFSVLQYSWKLEPHFLNSTDISTDINFWFYEPVYNNLGVFFSQFISPLHNLHYFYFTNWYEKYAIADCTSSQVIQEQKWILCIIYTRNTLLLIFCFGRKNIYKLICK